MAIGILVGIIPTSTGISLPTGLACWCVAMFLVLILSGWPTGVRIATLIAGLLLAVPCFLKATPLARFLFACAMAAPFLAAGALAIAPPMDDFRARLAYLLTWGGTQPMQRKACTFEGTAFKNLIVGTMAFAAVVAIVRITPSFGFGLPVRWLAGGIGIVAFAEMATAGYALITAAGGIKTPPLMISPHRSVTVSEFWTLRWNPFASQKLFRPLFFDPLAYRSIVLALFVTFGASSVVSLR